MSHYEKQSTYNYESINFNLYHTQHKLYFANTAFRNKISSMFLEKKYKNVVFKKIKTMMNVRLAFILYKILLSMRP